MMVAVSSGKWLAFADQIAVQMHFGELKWTRMDRAFCHHRNNRKTSVLGASLQTVPSLFGCIPEGEGIHGLKLTWKQ